MFVLPRLQRHSCAVIGLLRENVDQTWLVDPDLSTLRENKRNMILTRQGAPPLLLPTALALFVATVTRLVWRMIRRSYRDGLFCMSAVSTLLEVKLYLAYILWFSKLWSFRIVKKVLMLSALLYIWQLMHQLVWRLHTGSKLDSRRFWPRTPDKETSSIQGVWVR